ncbi:MAG: immunoglobulin domain-containing protein [Eubacterium sp.]|nr:immunoglobulin domain-containing protein [Eubacterium sp.]
MMKKLRRSIAFCLAVMMTISLCQVRAYADWDTANEYGIESINVGDVRVFVGDTDDDGYYDIRPEVFAITMDNDEKIEGHYYDVIDSLRDRYPGVQIDEGVEILEDIETDQLFIGQSYSCRLWIKFDDEFEISDNYNFMVISNPILDLQIEPVNILDSAEKETIETEDPDNPGNKITYERYNCHPQRAKLITEYGEFEGDINGILDDFINNRPGLKAERYWYDSQSPEFSYQAGESYEAYFRFGDCAYPYMVNIISNPIKEVTIDAGQRYLGDKQDWRDGYVDPETKEWVNEGFNCYRIFPDCFTVTFSDGSTATNDFDAVRERLYHLCGMDMDVYVYDEQTPGSWDAVGEYTAHFKIGDAVYDYSVNIVESPVTSLTVNDTAVLEGDTRTDGRDIHDEQGHDVYTEYQRYDNIWPTSIQVVINGKTYDNNDGMLREKLKAVLGHEPDIRSEDSQGPGQEWTVGKTYDCTFVVEGKRVPYKVTVKPNPIEEIIIDDVSRFADEKEMIHVDGIGDFEGYNIWHEGISIKINGTVYTGQEHPDIMGYLRDNVLMADYTWRIETDQTPDNKWDIGYHQATMNIAGIKTVFGVDIVDNPIDKIEVTGKRVFEGTMNNKIRGYEDPETGNWVDDEEFYGYDTWPGYIKVTLKNGTVLTDEDGQLYDKLKNAFGRDINWGCNPGQNPKNPWGIGEHECVFFIGNRSVTYTTEVVPVFISDVTLNDIYRLEGDTEERDGFDDEDGHHDINWTAYKTWQDDITVVTTDGNTYTGNPDDVIDRLCNDYKYNRNELYFSFFDTQTPDGPLWSVGDHEVNFEICGFSKTFKVKIYENPIVSITAEDFSRLEGDTHTERRYIEEYHQDMEFQAYDEWPDNLTVTFEDGEVLKDYRDDVIRQLEERFGFSFDMYSITDQGPDNLWCTGSHASVFHLAGFNIPYTINVVENPVAKIEVTDRRDFEGVKYVYRRDYYDAEKDEWINTPFYAYDTWPGSLKVTFKDGRVLEDGIDDVYGTIRDIVGADFYWGSDDNQNPNDPWTLGEYALTFRIGQVSADYSVFVIPTFIDSIEVTDKTVFLGNTITDYAFDKDGEHYDIEWSHYDCWPRYISVKTNDGKTYADENVDYVIDQLCEAYGYTRDELSYGCDNGEQSPFEDEWVKGSYEATFGIAGVTSKYTVNVIDNPIKSIAAESFKVMEGDTFPVQEFNDAGVLTYGAFYGTMPYYVKVVLKNNKVFKGNPFDVRAEIENYLGYGIDAYEKTDQNINNLWGPGTHECQVVFGGLYADYNIDIIPNTVKTITAKSVSMYNEDKTLETEYWDEEIQDFVKGEYYRYNYDTTITVTMVDGTKFTGDYDTVLSALAEYFDINRDAIGINIQDGQKPGNEWGAGTHKVTIGFYGVSSQFNVVVKKPIGLEITKQPVDASVIRGSKAKFTVTAAATNSDIAYQWQFSSDGGKTWKNSGVSGNNTNTISFTATDKLDGRMFRCVVTAGNKSLYTDEVTLTTKAVISTQPKNSAVGVGTTTSFSIKSRSSVAKYQWQISKDGGKTWANSKLTGYDTTTLSVEAKVNYNGYMFRCVVTNGTWEEISNAVKLTVKPVVLAQPEDVTEVYGNVAKFYFKVSGPDLKYQWYVRKDSNSKWAKSSSAGNDTAIIRLTATSTTNGREFMCKVTSGDIVIRSSIVKLTTKTCITTQPANKSVSVGGTAKFTVKATGTDLSYQWQVYENGAWTDATLTGAKTATLTVVKAKKTMSGTKYRCKVTNRTVTVCTKTVTLTVK